MGCGCNKSKTIKNSGGYKDSTTPYTPCIYCTTKHLAYAQALYVDGDARYLANLYLAYQHSRIYWDNIANNVVNLIQQGFNKQDISEELDNTLKAAHEIASLEDIPYNLGKSKVLSLSPIQHSFPLTSAARELYNYEIGYKHINTPYVIGLLQKATMFVASDYQQLLRELWKGIEDKTITIFKFDNVVSMLYNKL